ncbi:DUF6389 family protein [Pseudooctadecabacter sp.]|uniref:DUF6389 family protein n=1 Tax=Pseudooctadecabacter sp. TaxID=1966338 RepID=UPI0035C7E50A
MEVLSWIRRILRGTQTDTTTAASVSHADPLDDTRDEPAYRARLAAVLSNHSGEAVASLRGLFDALPDKTTGIDVMVHPAQEPDGQFTVMVHLSGPDIYVLNKAVGPWRELFATRITAAGREPRVPMFDPFVTAFSVNDVIVDVAADWVETVWRDAGGGAVAVRASVLGDEGYGPTTPRRLPTKDGA